MTDFTYFPSDAVGEDSLAEDAPTVQWVDQQLDEAEARGGLGGLALHVQAYSQFQADELAGLFSESESSSEEQESEEALHPPRAREEIRELIFSRLRRPDGAPYAAGYTTGPAARKAMYEGEDTRVGWRGPNNPAAAAQDGIVTHYEDRATLDQRAAEAVGGLVIGTDGNPVHGRWGWVVDDATGYLLLFDASHAEVTSPEGVTGPLADFSTVWTLIGQGYKVRTTHHTTPVAGMPVKGAGMVTLDHGRITEVSDESGHYRPDAVQQFATLQDLLAQGFDLNTAIVRLTGADMGGRPTDKAGWIREAVGENPLFPADDVRLRPEQFAQTGGDEYQIRAKMALNQEIRGRGQTPPASETPEQPLDSTYVVSGEDSLSDVSDDLSSDISSDISSEISSDYSDVAPRARDVDTDEDESSEQEGDDAGEDPDADFISQARAYLAAAGPSGFAGWFKDLSKEHQDLLLADPQIAATWQAAAAPAAPAWVPAEADYAAAATANATFVDSLDDRDSATFTVAGLMLLIGDGHSAAHQAHADTASDAITGTVRVRKAALGRGAGSLTFTGVPPAKQGVVRDAVARFSRKTVNFA